MASRLSCVLAGLALGAFPSARAVAAAETEAAARSPRIANYTIEARLDPATRLLTGSEIIAFRNATAHATSELRFHLYFNAWRNERSSFLKAAARGVRRPSLRDYGAHDWAYQDVTALSLLPAEGGAAPGVALPVQFIQPDDGNADDRTVLQARLPAALAPGQTIRLEVKWRLKVPRAIARAGVEGRYFLMSQWFPKLGVLEADGTWECRQFIQTEFYADFGTYDVSLTVPRGWTVGATGARVSSANNADGTATHRYRADDVHDFAWTTSPLFRVHVDRFEHPGLPPVDVELLLLPDHARLKDRYLASIKEALRLYGTWFGPYAWHRLTVVDPPSGSQTDGMEYPMFATGAARWLTLPGNRFTEANTIHEVGHMWWQGAVANDEFQHAWLDEALNTYSHRRILDEIYAPGIFEKRYFHDFLPVAFPGVPRAQPTHGADAFEGFRSPLTLESLATPSFRSDERVWYILPYLKGSLVLNTLERHLGWEVMRKILATYYQRFSFKHPKPSDFFAVANEVSGQDLHPFFAQVYAGTDLFDYGVDRVTSRPQRRPGGYGDGPEPEWQSGGAGGGQAPIESTVDVRRWGGGVFPIEVRVTFEDGSVADERWDGRARWTRFQYVRPAGVRTVEVDPRRVLVLDVNSTNNSWTSRPQATWASLKWTSKWAIWLQSLLESAAFFA